MKSATAKSIIAACICSLAPAFAHAEIITGRAKVTDGDTIQIGDQIVDLFDIDAPESGQLCFKKLQSLNESDWPCGLQAALALYLWIGDQTVTCEVTEREMHQPWPGRCAVAGLDLAEWLASNGWAVPYRDCKCGAIRDAAHNARAAQVGIWGSAFTLPWEWRKTH